MRERALLKEYETYKTEKKIKTPWLEALRLGFQKSYEAHDYATIVAIAKKIPSDVVETDEKLLRYFDRAQLHLKGLFGVLQETSSTEKGPSLRSRTFMSAPKRPVPTRSGPSRSLRRATTCS